MTKRFELRVLEAASDKFPDVVASMGRAQAIETIRTGIEKTKAREMNAEDEVIAYILLMFEFGPEFETTAGMAWAKSLLDDPDIPADARMEMLVERLSAERSRQAARSKS